MGGYASGRKELMMIYLDGSLWEGMDQEERN